MIATEEYHRWWLKWLFKIIGCIPVDRIGKPEKAFQAALRALEVGEVIGVFPQGRIQEPGEGAVELKRGVVALAHLADVPIVPLHISGISGAGHIILAVFLRSTARIKAAHAIHVSDTKDEAALLELSEFVNRGVVDG
jgi:1-acyl-sn-glycerol-3-phosphate acyltransferase